MYSLTKTLDVVAGEFKISSDYAVFESIEEAEAALDAINAMGGIRGDTVYHTPYGSFYFIITRYDTSMHYCSGDTAFGISYGSGNYDPKFHSAGLIYAFYSDDIVLLNGVSELIKSLVAGVHDEKNEGKVVDKHGYKKTAVVEFDHVTGDIICVYIEEDMNDEEIRSELAMASKTIDVSGVSDETLKVIQNLIQQDKKSPEKKEADRLYHDDEDKRAAFYDGVEFGYHNQEAIRKWREAHSQY